MKPYFYIALIIGLMLSGPLLCANTLNEAVKEARQHGQVLSAKTRQGMHEIRVVTPGGSVKTIRKPASDNLSNQRQPDNRERQNYYQQRSEPLSQQPRQNNRRNQQRSRKPTFRRFDRRPTQSSKPRSRPRPSPPKRQPPTRGRNDNRDPD